MRAVMETPTQGFLTTNWRRSSSVPATRTPTERRWPELSDHLAKRELLYTVVGLGRLTYGDIDTIGTVRRVDDHRDELSTGHLEIPGFGHDHFISNPLRRLKSIAALYEDFIAPIQMSTIAK